MVGIMLAFNGAFKRKKKKKMLMTTAIIKKIGELHAKYKDYVVYR